MRILPYDDLSCLVWTNFTWVKSWYVSTDVQPMPVGNICDSIMLWPFVESIFFLRAANLDRSVRSLCVHKSNFSVGRMASNRRNYLPSRHRYCFINSPSPHRNGRSSNRRVNFLRYMEGLYHHALSAVGIIRLKFLVHSVEGHLLQFHIQ